MRFNAYRLSKMGEVIHADITELSEDDLPPGDILVEVEWSAVNFKDAMVTRPGNRVARQFPLIPGVEFTGTIVESGVPTLPPGRRVLAQGYDLGVARHGGFAGCARVPSGWIVPLPPGVSCRAAAIIGLAGFTAVLSVHRLEQHGMAPDDGPVLVTGASGGVGSTTVALLAHRGFEVVASSGKGAEHEYLTQLGAAKVVGRQFSPDDGRTLGPQMWGGVVDCVGGSALSEALRTVRYGGAVAASGLTGGNELSSTVYPFIVRGVALLGIDTVATPIAERRALWSAMAQEFPMDRCEEMVSEVVGLNGLSDALSKVLQGAARGRILVDPHR